MPGKDVRLHDLRHYVATRLLSADVGVRTVAGRLGHRNAAMTLNVYSHFLAESDREAANVLGRLLDDAVSTTRRHSGQGDEWSPLVGHCGRHQEAVWLSRGGVNDPATRRCYSLVVGRSAGIRHRHLRAVAPRPDTRDMGRSIHEHTFEERRARRRPAYAPNGTRGVGQPGGGARRLIGEHHMSAHRGRPAGDDAPVAGDVFLSSLEKGRSPAGDQKCASAVAMRP